jgi:hypothetical protein
MIQIKVFILFIVFGVEIIGIESENAFGQFLIRRTYRVNPLNIASYSPTVTTSDDSFCLIEVTRNETFKFGFYESESNLCYKFTTKPSYSTIIPSSNDFVFAKQSTFSTNKDFFSIN